MITNFETITKPLSKFELDISEILITKIRNHPKEWPIKNDALIEYIQNKIIFELKETKYKLKSNRLRKIINHIRATGTHAIIGSKNGYYSSYDINDIRKQINSLRERAAAINRAADGLDGIIKYITEYL